MDQKDRYEQHLSTLAEAPNVLRPLLRLEHDGGREWSELVSRLTSRAEQTGEATSKARLYLEAARIAFVHMRERQRGLELLEAAEQTDVSAPLDAEIQLFRLAFEGEERDLLGYFTKALEQAGSNDTRARLYLRMGFILEYLFENPGEADNSYEYARESVGRDYFPALWSRQRLARRCGDVEQLGELLTEEFELHDEPSRQSEIATELGQLHLEARSDEGIAEEYFEIAYELDGTNEKARQGLVDLGRLDVDSQAPPPEPSGERAPDETVPPETPEPDATTELDVDEFEQIDEVPGDTDGSAPIEDDLKDEEVVDLDEVSEAELESSTDDVPDAPTGDETRGTDGETSPPPEAETREETSTEEVETLDAEETSPPDMPGESATNGGEEVTDLEDVSDAEFDADEPAPGEAEVPEAEAVKEAEVVEISEDDSIEGEPDESSETAADETAEFETVDQEDEAAAEDAPRAETEEETTLEGEDDARTDERGTSELDADDVAEAEAGEATESEAATETAETEPVGDEESVDTVEAETVGDEKSVDTTETTDDEPAPEPRRGRTWEERAADYRERARDADDSTDALDWLVESVELQWLHRELDDVACWDDAIELDLVEPFYERMHYYVDDTDYWSEVLDRLEAADVDDALLGRIAHIDASDRELGRTYADASGDETLDQIDEDLEEAESSWRRFKRSLRKRYDDLPDDEQARETYEYLADLALGLELPDKEVDALRRLDREVDDDVARDRLMVAYRRSETWPRYADAIEQKAESLDDTRIGDKVDWLQEAVRVCRDEMNHDTRVLSTYRRILEIDPENREAIDQLIELYDDLNRPPDLIDALEKKAALVEDDDETIELYTRIADLFLDNFRNEGEAIDAYQKILEIDPHHEEAIDFLREMYEKRRDWDKLVEIRRREVETIDDEAEKTRQLQDVAELAADRLREPDEAIGLWREVRERAPEDPDALDALEELYEKKRDYASLADVLEQKVELLDDEEEQASLYHKMGRIYSDRIEEVEPAIDAWRRALEIDPDDRKARNALEGLYVEHQKWDELEAFYADRDAYRDLVRKFKTLTGSADEPVELEILLRSARVWREELDETDRAKRNLEQALEIDGHHEGAARQLEPIYREAEAYGDLRDVLEIVLEHQDDPEQRRRYELELAQLQDGPLDHPDVAFERYARALREVPSGYSVADDLEEVAERIDRWFDVVEVYEEILAEADLEWEATREYRMRSGEILFDELDRSDEALAQFEAVLEEDDEDVEALAAMEQIFEHQERWDDLMGVYERRFELTDSTEEQVESLRGMGRMAETQKGDVDEAIARLDRALKLDPSDEETLAELHRLYRQEERHTDLADIVEREIELIEARADERADADEPPSHVDPADVVDAETLDALAVGSLEPETTETSRDRRYTEEELDRLVDLYAEYGRVQQRHLYDDDAAIDAFRRVLTWRPSHLEARSGLEYYLEETDDPARLDRVAQLLEPVYTLHEAWPALVDVLEIQIETEDDEDAIVERLERIADLYLDALGTPVDSFETYARIVRRRPHHEEARAQLHRIAGAEGLWRSLADLYEKLTLELEESDDELLIDYLFDLGDIYGERLEEPERAAEYYHDVLDIRDDATEALDALEVLYARMERWRDLLEIYERQLEFADGEAARAIQFRMAILWEQQLERPDEALAVLRDILESDEEHLRAVRTMNRMLEENERWRELAESIERELELVDDSEIPDVQRRLAAIHRERLGDDARAVDLYESVLDDRPDDTAALEALETMMHEPEPPSRRISEILEPLYVENEDWAPLIEALDVQVAHGDVPEERLETLHRIASLQDDELDVPREAFETQARALQEDPEDEETLDALYRLADELGDWEALVEVFVDEADARSAPDVVRDLLRRAAELHLEDLDQPREATPLLHEVLDLFPGDLETAEQLESIYRDLEDWEELVDILQHRADHVEESETRKGLLYQAGNLYDDVLEDPQAAVGVYRDVLGIDEADRQAIDRLEELYSRLEQWENLLEIYQTKLELVDSPEARKDLLYVIAPLYEDQLDRPYDAIETYRTILDEIDAEEIEALEALADLYEETEQWHELLEVLEQQRDLVSIDEERLELHYDIGRIWETKLGDVLQAVEVYADILDEQPNHEPTREALEALIERGEAEVEAAEVLEPIYEEAEEWEKLVHVLELLVEASHDPEQQLELYRQIGELYEERLDEPSAAFETYLAGVEVDPSREDFLDTAERLAGELETWNVLIDRLDAELEETNDFAVTTELNRRIGRILDEELDDPRGAIARYERALEAEPEHPAVNAALDRLYQEEGQWDELTDVLQTRLRIVDGPDDLIDLRSRLALLYKEELDRTDDAIDTIQRILEDRPEHELAIELLEEMFTSGRRPERIMGILEPYYRERDRHEDLVHVYERRLERLDDPLERVELLRQIGDLHLGELDAPSEALKRYGEALVEQPDAEELVERVGELAEDTGDWELAAKYYSEALEDPSIRDEAAVRLWLRLADVLERELDQIEDAEMAYLQVLDIDPGHPEALESLDRIYESRERWHDLADILHQRLDHTYEEELSVELEFRLAQVYQYELESSEEAIETYHDLLDLRPRHEEALSELETLHRQGERWEELYDVLTRRTESTAEPDEQVEIYAQMARLAEDEEMLDRPLDAIDCWRDVLNLQPDHAEALDELGRLYFREQRWEDLVDILERKLELTDDPEEQIELYSSLGTVWGDELDGEGPALDAWEQVLGLAPDHLEALHALRDLYRRRDNYVELADVLERLIAHDEVGDDEHFELWLELAEIRTDDLLEPEAAIEAWREVLSKEPEHERALEELEELYLQEGKWEEAANILEIQADRTDDEDGRIDILGEVAELWQQRIGEPQRAATFYEQIRELDPTDLEANRELESIYLQQDDQEAYLDLVDVYLDRAEAYGDQHEQRLETLRSAAEIFREELDAPQKAFVVLQSAFEPETADDPQLLSELEEMARETNLWGELLETVEEVVRELGDTLEAAELHERAGEWAAEQLDRPDDAIYHLRRALDIDPDRVEIFESLESLYRDIEAWPELADVLEERIDHAVDPDVEIDLWRKLGELYDIQLEQPDDAIDAYWQILEIDETDLLAIESLERIYEEDERWHDLIEILERKAESAYGEDEIEIRRRIASIWEERIGDADRAVQAYRQLADLERDADVAYAFESLERLYREREEWHELLNLYEDELTSTHEPEEQLLLHGKRATVFEDHLDDPEAAIDAYEDVQMLEPENETALDNLERLYGQTGAWLDLVDVLQQHIEIAEEPVEEIELRNELARIQWNQLDEPYAAIEAYEASLEIAPDQPAVLVDLAELHVQTQNWQRAVEVYRDLIEHLEDTGDIVDIHFTVADILEDELHNDEEAEQHYRQALDLDPDYQPARDALERLYDEREEWDALIDLYADAAEQTLDLTEKAIHLADIGEIYELELEERDRALDYYEQALEEDPNLLDAAEPLIDLYLEDDLWEKTVPLLERAIERYEQSEEVTLEELEDRYVQLATVYEDLEQREAALEQYWNAYELDRDDVDVLLGLGRLLFEVDDYDAAADIFEELEARHLGVLEEDELQELYYKTGRTREAFGETESAIDYYERALEIEGYHRETLESLVDLHADVGNWERVVEYNRRLREVDEDPSFQFARLTRIGEVCADELGDTGRAVEAYREALEIRPNSVAVLRKLLEIYRSTGQWHEALDMLDRLIEQQDDSSRRAHFNYVAAVICRDELQNADRAIEYFEASLDAEPTEKLEDAFPEIERLYRKMAISTDDEQAKRSIWKELERSYRDMLHRIAESAVDVDDQIKFTLWKGLGEIYRSHLTFEKNWRESAVKAFTTASQLHPGDERVRLILAELHDQRNDVQQVVQQHRSLLEQDPFRIESYKALFDAYMDADEYDHAWCIASALVFLEQASPREREMYEKYSTPSLRRASRPLDRSAYNKLQHPDQDQRTTNIMQILNQGLREYYAEDISRWGIDPRSDELDLDGGSMFGDIYKYAVETLSIAPEPNVYLKRDQALGVRNANVHPPGIIAGADIVRNQDEGELAFRLSTLLGAMRPEYYLASIEWPTEGLKMLFMAAMYVTNPTEPLEQSLGESGLEWAGLIQKMPQQMQMELKKHVSEFLETGENPDLSAWRRHVEHTTNRLGLLICGDLNQAATCIRNGQIPIDKGEPRDQIHELILFAISDEFVDLRRRLGLAIGQ